MLRPTIFISYHRGTGADLATLIHEKLNQWKCDSFRGVEANYQGIFDADDEIINREYFIVILTRPALRSEWVKREIATALSLQKKIILVTKDGFRPTPDNLPPEIVALSECKKQLRYDRNFEREFFNKLRAILFEDSPYIKYIKFIFPIFFIVTITLLYSVWREGNKEPPPQNDSPQIEPIVSPTLTVDEILQIEIEVKDSDGNIISIDATSNNPTVLLVQMASNILNLYGVSPGEATVTITARDSSGNEDTLITTIQVSPNSNIPSQDLQLIYYAKTYASILNLNEIDRDIASLSFVFGNGSEIFPIHRGKTMILPPKMCYLFHKYEHETISDYLIPNQCSQVYAWVSGVTPFWNEGTFIIYSGDTPIKICRSDAYVCDFSLPYLE